MTILPLLLSALAVPQGVAFDARLVPEWESAFEICIELADWDRNGEVTGAELTRLCGWLSGVTYASVTALKTELVLQGLNRDKLDEWTLHDVEASLAALGGGSGAFSIENVTYEQLCNGEVGTRGLIRRLASELLLETVDANSDGAVTVAERAALVAGLGSAPDEAGVGRWVVASMRREPADRNRMAPGVSFLTLGKGIARADDARVMDLGAFSRWFRLMDKDQNSVLTRSERHPPRQADLDREFWKEPSDERLKQLCLMPWQRSLDDALAVQRRTGQALLICVNMDDETACDSLASWRYRDPAFAALAAGYVCLVVSPDDHQPRDYDDRGRRLVSPRLGRVTDREHIDLEPVLYERYFSEVRVAPRHVGVDVDGTILFDRYLLNDPKELDRQLREHARESVAIDWSALGAADLAGYADAAAREEMERRMLDVDPQVRLEAASFAGAMPEAGMIGLRDPLVAVREVAARALAASAGSLDAPQMARLLGAAAALGGETRSAVRSGAMMAVEGDAFSMAALDSLDPSMRVSALGSLADWSAAASLATLREVPVLGRDQALDALDRLDAMAPEGELSAARSLVRAQALLGLAEALVAIAEDPRDAASEVVSAAIAGASADPARADALRARAAFISGDFADSVRSARLALPSLWAATSDPAYIGSLRALAGGGTQLAYGLLKTQQPVPPSLVADVALTARTLMAHPAGRAADATGLLDLLGAVRAGDLMGVVLEEALGRFPGNPDLHQRFRAHRLASMGSASMEAAYDALEEGELLAGYGPTRMWFRGLALLVAAEWEVQQGAPIPGLALYESSVAALLASVASEPSFADSAHHYAVLSLAGAASLAAEAGDLEVAGGHLVSAAALRASSLDEKDGLGRTPRERAAALLPGILQAVSDEHRATLRSAFPE